MWHKVQGIVSRYEGKAHRRGEAKKIYEKHVHNLPYAGLITCGKCGGAIIGEIQRGRLKRRDYIYYRCAKRCDRYIRQEAIEEKMGACLARLQFNPEILEILTKALRESHTDEIRHREECVNRLRRDQDRFQVLLDRLADGFLSGRFDDAFYERKRDELRREQDRIANELESHKRADRGFIDYGTQLLDVARRSKDLYESQTGFERLRLLEFFLSNPVLRDGEIQTEYRKPFDLLEVAVAHAHSDLCAPDPQSGLKHAWLGR